MTWQMYKIIHFVFFWEHDHQDSIVPLSEWISLWRQLTICSAVRPPFPDSHQPFSPFSPEVERGDGGSGPPPLIPSSGVVSDAGRVVFQAGGSGFVVGSVQSVFSLVLVPTYTNVGPHSLWTCSQPICWMYACAAFYLIFYTGLEFRFGAV
jgi:hypothetical protein